jgi:hypothetical protein
VYTFTRRGRREGRREGSLELANLWGAKVLQEFDDAVAWLQGASGPPERRGARGSEGGDVRTALHKKFHDLRVAGADGFVDGLPGEE